MKATRPGWGLDAAGGEGVPVSFELESRGGYRRMVTGTIAYVDAEAHTYMVLAADGELIRVPLRDITKRSRASRKDTNKRPPRVPHPT